MMSTKKIPISVWVDEETAKALESASEKEARSKSFIASKILRDILVIKDEGAKQWPLNFHA